MNTINIVKVLLSGAVVVAVGSVVVLSVQRHERVECQQWQAQSVEYALYSSTNWQLQQCARYGITLEK